MSVFNYNCSNHPELRWWSTKPNGSMVFAGEVDEDGFLIKEAAMYPLPPLVVLKHRLNGRNPFAPEMEWEAVTTWDAVVAMVAQMEESRLTRAYECACPPGMLVTLGEGEAPRGREGCDVTVTDHADSSTPAHVTDSCWGATCQLHGYLLDGNWEDRETIDEVVSNHLAKHASD